MFRNTFSRAGMWKFVRGTSDSVTITAQLAGDQPRELTLQFPAAEDTLEAALYAGAKWQINRIVKFRRVPQT